MFGVGLLFVVIVLIALANTGKPILLAVLAFVALWTMAAWHAFRTGVYLNKHGVMIRQLWTKRWLPWSSIARFESRQDREPLIEVGRRTIVAVLEDGSVVLTPLQRAGDWDLRWRTPCGNDGGPLLPLRAFEAVLATLVRSLEDAKR